MAYGAGLPHMKSMRKLMEFPVAREQIYAGVISRRAVLAFQAPEIPGNLCSILSAACVANHDLHQIVDTGSEIGTCVP